jgi:ribosomal protein S6--L-glutamate ligase
MKKNIVILSESKNGYSNEKILQELTRRGHNARVVLPGQLAAITRSRDGIFENGQRIYKNQIDAVIARGGAAGGFGLAMLRHLEENVGIPVVNGWEAMMAASDKFLTHQILSSSGIPSPRTLFVKQANDLEKLVATVGGFPVIVKPVSGSQGRGVVFVTKETKSAIEALTELSSLIVQEYTPYQSDVRAIVLDGVVIAAMERVQHSGDFRANISRGASGRAIELTQSEKELCSRAASCIKLTFAGVDLLRLKNGQSIILEVNGSPGLKISEVIPGARIVEKLADFIEQLTRKPPPVQLPTLPKSMDSEQFEHNINADKVLWFLNQKTT